MTTLERQTKALSTLLVRVGATNKDTCNGSPECRRVARLPIEFWCTKCLVAELDGCSVKGRRREVTTTTTKKVVKQTKKGHRRRLDCPVCGHPHDGTQPKSCDMVWGRRGWRQLGSYDG